MRIEHHPAMATLLAYGAGTLDEAFSVLVASHVSLCPACRDVVRDAEEMGAALSDGEDGGSCDFEALMARIDADPDPDPAPAPVASVGGDVPYPLHRLVGPSLDGIRWRYVAPGVRKADLSGEVGGGAALFLLKIAPGKAMPEHGHGGVEVVVLEPGQAGHLGVTERLEDEPDVFERGLVDLHRLTLRRRVGRSRARARTFQDSVTLGMPRAGAPPRQLHARRR